MKIVLFALALVAMFPVAGGATTSGTTSPSGTHAKASTKPVTGKGKHCKKNCTKTAQKGLQP